MKPLIVSKSIMAIITLLTDFGIQDEYAGLLKGVILAIHPDAKPIDLTHHIPPQDIVQAAYILKASFAYFPVGTIHLAVVDPGVGSTRRIIAAHYAEQFFIAPDNGLLTPIWGNDEPETLVQVQNRAYYLKSVSQTFHGRDIIAPVAAHLSRGLALTDLGPPLAVNQLTPLPLPQSYSDSQGCIVGQVVAVDHFGNLITNIHKDQLPLLDESLQTQEYKIQVGGYCIQGISSSYLSVPEQNPIAIIGSRNYLEIAVNKGSAAKVLNAGKRTPVSVISVA